MSCCLHEKNPPKKDSVPVPFYGFLLDYQQLPQWHFPDCLTPSHFPSDPFFEMSEGFIPRVCVCVCCAKMREALWSELDVQQPDSFIYC